MNLPLVILATWEVMDLGHNSLLSVLFLPTQASWVRAWEKKVENGHKNMGIILVTIFFLTFLFLDLEYCFCVQHHGNISIITDLQKYNTFSPDEGLKWNGLCEINQKEFQDGMFFFFCWINVAWIHRFYSTYSTILKSIYKQINSLFSLAITSISWSHFWVIWNVKIYIR